MKLILSAGLAAATAVFAAGCTTVRVESSDPADSGVVSSVGPITVSDELTALMSQVGCTEHAQLGVEIHARETGGCKLGAEEIAISLFDSETMRDSWVSDSKAGGRYYVVGDGWGAATESPDAASVIAEKLDGKPAS